MSNPGLTTAQLTPEYLQQLQDSQDQQRKSQMAYALMQNKANPNTPYAGLANVAGDLAGAYASKQMEKNANWAAQGISPVNVTPNQMTGKGGSQSWLSNLFSLGSGS